MAAGRGAKIGIVLAVLAMILIGVLFVVDRIAVGVAEDRIKEQVQKELVANKATIEGEPDVDVTGWPFLTQVVGGEYEKITIGLDRPKLNNVQIDTLDVQATSVRADARDLMNGTGEIVAGSVVGTATISWANVRPLLETAGLPTAIDPSKIDLKVVNNKIEIRVPFAFSGFEVMFIGRGSMAVETGRVRLKLEEVTTDRGDLPPQAQNLVRQYQQRLQVTLRLPGLPYNLVVNKVETTEAGMLVIASAADVKLSG